MCLILFAVGVSPRYPLVLAGNRDEYHDRPTAPAAYWPPGEQVLGGRDLSAGGSWLAVSRRGRLAAVTNHRDGPGRTGPRSRGHLVSAFVDGDAPAAAHLDAIAPDHSAYGGFNLLLWQANTMRYGSNRGPANIEVTPGVHGLSNGLLDTPWPKLVSGVAGLQAALQRDTADPTDALLALLSNRTEASKDDLPATGIAPDWERRLSAAFIVTERYGTRASTVVLVDRSGALHFVERSFDPEGQPVGDQRFVMENFASPA